MATKFVLSAFVAHVSQYAAEGQRVTQAARAVRVAKAFILETDGSPWELDDETKAAADKGGNAVLAMRFDTGDIGASMNEVAAYGTAVTIRPIQS